MVFVRKVRWHTMLKPLQRHLLVAIIILPCFIVLVKHGIHLHVILQEAEDLERQLVSIQTPPKSDNNKHIVTAKNYVLHPQHERPNTYNQSNHHFESSSSKSSSYKQKKPFLHHTNQTVANDIPPTNCSCVTRTAFDSCCQRAIVLVHKMGVTAMQNLRDEFIKRDPQYPVATPEIMSRHPHGVVFDQLFREPTRSKDYRHVVVTRNWYDSIVSGYLYHKTGRECWLDWFGRPGHEGWLLNNTSEQWEHRLLHHHTIKSLNVSWTPGRGRDLCQYLHDETEEMGLRVYAAWAVVSYMFPLLRFRHRRVEWEKQKGWNRTMFVCYEQLISAPTVFTNATSDWLFPNGHGVAMNMTVTNTPYRGDHATNKDPMLRSRLRQIVSRIDAELFRGTIGDGSAEFGCGEAR